MKRITVIAVLLFIAGSLSADKMVSSYTVSKDKITLMKTYWGIVTPEETVNVVSKYPGRIHTMNFEEGGRVKKGDILYTVDREMTGMEYNLIEEKSPISGIIVKKLASIGQYIGPGVPVYMVINDNNQTIQINIFPEEQEKFKHAPRLTAVANGDKYALKYDKIIPIGDMMSGMLTVKLTASGIRFASYERVKIEMVEREETGIVIPLDVLVKEGNRYVVYKIKDDKAVKAYVETGLQNDYYALIKKGLNEGETIIRVGAHLVNDGETVRIMSEGK